MVSVTLILVVPSRPTRCSTVPPGELAAGPGCQWTSQLRPLATLGDEIDLDEVAASTCRSPSSRICTWPPAGGCGAAPERVPRQARQGALRHRGRPAASPWARHDRPAAAALLAAAASSPSEPGDHRRLPAPNAVLERAVCSGGRLPEATTRALALPRRRQSGGRCSPPVYDHQSYTSSPTAAGGRAAGHPGPQGSQRTPGRGGGQPGRRRRSPVSDFFDFSVCFVDAAEADIQRWYVERFLALRRNGVPGRDSVLPPASRASPTRRPGGPRWASGPRVNGPNLAATSPRRSAPGSSCEGRRPLTSAGSCSASSDSPRCWQPVTSHPGDLVGKSLVGASIQPHLAP